MYKSLKLWYKFLSTLRKEYGHAWLLFMVNTVGLAHVIVRGKSLLEMLEHKLCPRSALIVTGGGFQGIRTMGMLCGLKALGFSGTFGAGYGVSSGACNIAFFLARQAVLAASIYYLDLVDGRYASLTRWPVVDMDYLVYEVFGRYKVLDTQDLIQSPTKFLVGVTDETGSSRVIAIQKEFFVLDAIRASMSILFWAGRGVRWQDQWYSDGMLSCPLPFRRALDDGYRNILVLLNMPIGWRDPPDGIFSRVVKRLWFKNMSSTLRRAYFSRQKCYADQLKDLLRGKLPSDANITVIAPSTRCLKLPFYTRDAQALKKGAEEGIAIIGEVFRKPLAVKLRMCWKK